MGGGYTVRRSEIYHLAQYAVLTCTALPDTDKLEILEQLVVDARSARWSEDQEANHEQGDT